MKVDKDPNGSPSLRERDTPLALSMTNHVCQHAARPCEIGCSPTGALRVFTPCGRRLQPFGTIRFVIAFNSRLEPKGLCDLSPFAP
jgi:hypothetical protein